MKKSQTRQKKKKERNLEVSRETKRKTGEGERNKEKDIPVLCSFSLPLFPVLDLGAERRLPSGYLLQKPAATGPFSRSH